MNNSNEKKILLEVVDLVKSYSFGDHHQKVIDGLNLQIYEGDFIGLYGRSGCGKTTLLNILGGIDHFDAGRVLFLGKNFKTLTANDLTKIRKEFIGFIFQTFNLIPVLTVFENVELPLVLLKWESNRKQEAVISALQSVGMGDFLNRFPHQLSGGQRQRVAIARAIVKNPKLIIADEPTANLDEENSKIIAQLLIDIQKKLKTTVICSSHDREFLDYSTKKVTIKNGKELINAVT